MFMSDGGYKLLVALGDSLGVAPPLWLRSGCATIVAAAYPCPQQCCETGISAGALRALHPLGATAFCGADCAMPSDATRLLRHLSGCEPRPSMNTPPLWLCGLAARSVERVTTRRRSACM